MNLIVVFLILMPIPCFGYIEFGTGSYFLQIFLAVFLSGLFVMKQYWKKVISSFRKSRKDNPEK